MSTLTDKQKLISQIKQISQQLDCCRPDDTSLAQRSVSELKVLLVKLERHLMIRQAPDPVVQARAIARQGFGTLGRDRGWILEGLRRHLIDRADF